MMTEPKFETCKVREGICGKFYDKMTNVALGYKDVFVFRRTFVNSGVSSLPLEQINTMVANV